MSALMREYEADGVIHLAAESHVDRSIRDPFTFAKTNVLGTLSLLEAARVYWESCGEGYDGKLFYHISTDEVYGALEMTVLRASNLRSRPRHRAANIIRLTARSSSPRPPNITLTRPIRLRKRRRTISSGPTTIRTACRRW